MDKSQERELSIIIKHQGMKNKVHGNYTSPKIRDIKKKRKLILSKKKEIFSPQKEAAEINIATTASSKSEVNKSDNTLSNTTSSPTTQSWLRESSSKKEKKKSDKSKKKLKKKKKQSKKTRALVSDILVDSDLKPGIVMSEYTKQSKIVVSVNDELYMYNPDNGCYDKADYKIIASYMKSSLDIMDQYKVTTKEYKEAIEQLKISDDIKLKDGFFENGPYVNCLNGVVDVMSGKLLEYSHEFYFRHCINANYLPDEKCPKFLEYIEFITEGDKELTKLIRAMLGYIFSHYNNAKKAFLIYGIPHTGKSLLCNVVERILGSQYVSHVDLTFLQKQEYAASLEGKLLNVAPDLRNDALKDVRFFKSLVSHDDSISVRMLYSNPKDLKCEAKMLFSSNHLLTFDKTLSPYDVEAVFNRLIYIPFQNKPISDENDNKHLSDELFKERDGIFTWAMKGLRDYTENNENFPECKLSAEIKADNMAVYCPEKIFFEKYIKRDKDVYESSSKIREAYDLFCCKLGIKSTTNSILNFLEEHQRIKKCKKRIDDTGNITSVGNPIYVYEGIRLKKKLKFKE